MCSILAKPRLLPSLNENNNRCTKVRFSVRNNKDCGGILKECERTSKKRNSDGTFKKYISFKCSKRGCQIYCSIRKQNPFFSYLDLNNRCHSNLSLTEISRYIQYIHSTVNHQKWFIDPDTNANTQTIECLWKIVKKRYEIRVNGASPLLPRQLKEEWWRSLHPNKQTIFDEFLSDIRHERCF